jgi:zinc finger-containing ubiquitin peptidase 1
MLCSYIVHVRFPGYSNINSHIPSIFQIQDYIEKAWDVGINTQGRIETGGVRGTRKYIGTPEVRICVLCGIGTLADRHDRPWPCSAF